MVFLNGCILFNIGLINNKLEIVANFNVFFVTIWVLCRLSHNKRTCTSPSWFETRQLSLSFTRLLAQLHVCMVSIKWPVTSLLLEGLVTLVWSGLSLPVSWANFELTIVFNSGPSCSNLDCTFQQINHNSAYLMPWQLDRDFTNG